MTTRTRGATIVWLQQDLRVSDHPALFAASQSGEPVIPVFIWSPEEEGDWPAGAARRWWLHHSLSQMQNRLRELGTPLVLRRGPALETLLDIARTSGATHVVWHRRYEPAAIARATRVKAELLDAGLEAESFNGSLLTEPWTLATEQGRPFQVFSPFWKKLQRTDLDSTPLPAPPALVAPATAPRSLALDALELLPRRNWANSFSAVWQPGESGAWQRLEQFLDAALEQYGSDRNRPDLPGSSRLSPHLHHGEISPRQVWAAVLRRQRHAGRLDLSPGAECFLREIGWREFAYHLLFHFPATPTRPLRSNFEGFPWADDPRALRAWQRGRTGYPMVDAAMRELWQTGWMHNRSRMVVASFLVKHLLLPWNAGAAWFWDTLVDADLASNTLGWQWTAGCGADAAPYFRIFNPVLQGDRFDPEGAYVRRYVPELSGLKSGALQRPWEQDARTLAAAGIELGRTYPAPIVDHAFARQRALAALEACSTKGEIDVG